MISKKLKAVPVEISWGNIQDQIAALLYATGKIPESNEITAIKFNLPDDLLAREKIIKMEVITKGG